MQSNGNVQLVCDVQKEFAEVRKEGRYRAK
jgi:hypothetical protein